MGEAVYSRRQHGDGKGNRGCGGVTGEKPRRGSERGKEGAKSRKGKQSGVNPKKKKNGPGCEGNK